jgi:hypothetical protein
MNIPASADTIALIDATPLPTVDRNGAPITYAQAQYNMGGIQAASVPLPAFLNINPEVVNRVATELEARTLVPQQINKARGSVSPVNSAMAAVDPQLPISVPVAGPVIGPVALPPSVTLQALLNNGEWGNAFIGLVQDIRTPLQITTASIDSIFEWDRSVLGNQARIDSYVQEIVNLLELPAGVRLFRDIIVVHHCLPYLPKVKFISNGEESSATVFDYPKSCKINLKWDDVKQQHVGGKRIVVAKNNAIAIAVGNPGEQLDFITAHVPPSVVLAHELGHYLDDLMACKNVMDAANHVGIVGEAITSSSAGVKVSYEEDMFRVGWGVRTRYPQYEYKDVLRKIIPNPPSTPAEDAFVDLWDQGMFSEMVNILPVARVLNDGGSSYSDGIIMGEAYLDNNCAIHQRLFFTRKRNGSDRETPVNVGGVVLSAESFARLGHASPSLFWEIFNSLDAAVPAAGGLSERDEFKNLVATMLGLITVPNPAGGPPIQLSAANNNLPNF